MDFKLSEEQQEVQNLSRKILEDKVTNEYLRDYDNNEQRFDKKLWSDLAQAGLLGVAVEEQYGGMGFDYETLCLLVEEVGRSVAPLPVVPALVSAALTLQKFGSAAQKESLLPGLVQGEYLLSAAFIEANNEDQLNPQVTASQQGDSWQLSGEKYCVPFAPRAKAILLAATTADGLVLFLLDPHAEGVTLHAQQTTAGENQFALQLENAVVSTAEVLAEGQQAEDAINFAIEHSMGAYCAQAVGVTDKMMRMTAAYTSEREQFGVKIATFQAVGQRAADCYIDVECMRLVTQQAVAQLNAGNDASQSVMVAKIWAGDATHRVSHAAQHLHGGMGVDRDYALWRYCLWAKQLELTLGSSAQMTERLGDAIAADFKAA